METRYVAGSARMKTVTSVNISYDYYRNFCYAYCFAKCLYFKLDLVRCAEYLEHLASRIFTLFMPFLLISSIASILCLLILKKTLFESFDFIKNTNSHPFQAPTRPKRPTYRMVN